MWASAATPSSYGQGGVEGGGAPLGGKGFLDFVSHSGGAPAGGGGGGAESIVDMSAEKPGETLRARNLQVLLPKISGQKFLRNSRARVWPFVLLMEFRGQKHEVGSGLV